MRRRLGLVAAVVAGGIVVGASTVGAALPPTAQPSAFCIPIIMPCAPAAPSPTPSPSSSGGPGLPLPGLPGTTPGAGTPSTPGTSSPSPTPSASATPDPGAPVFTQPPAQLGSQSLSFSGLKGIELVTVPLADGSRVPVLKLSADRITIGGFSLTVRRDTGPVLVTTADQMTLTGHVEVYVDSLTATTPDGHSLTLGAHTPPPADGIAPLLGRVTLGLVGATADSIVYTNTDQQLKG
ncbi:MAG: hypothetical protein J0J05_14640 [Microbacterium sp.]|uniref:hypothetical protein n=1 Tax=Microbacterium sp. TaxID=51671 RepID=UPI001AC35221|nr:hypothetical protein [Microbacterium sp.]MBN9155215.1 hypothetical protein [Microbacterium sp.]